MQSYSKNSVNKSNGQSSTQTRTQSSTQSSSQNAVRSLITPQHAQTLGERFKNRVLFDEPLAPYLAYQIGGPADALVFPQNETDLENIRQTAKEFQLPVTIVGTGTNLLVLDEGVRGIVVTFSKGFREISAISETAGGALVRCGAGVTKPELLQWAIDRGLSGLEFSSGVPGTLGGGIFMNAGTKYGCYADILREFTVFDLDAGLQTYEAKEFSFGYRQQNALKPNRFVVSMVFALAAGDANQIQTEVNRIIAERAEKQPLDYPSCGSTFKNPEGHSAGRLIEKAGLKGTRIGGAEISLKHANFFLNKGNASAADILGLIQMTQQTVWEKFQVQLECEVVVLGGDGSLSTVYNSH
jgi:UDP-N-acetylmuramate dehydrogenase